MWRGERRKTPTDAMMMMVVRESIPLETHWVREDGVVQQQQKNELSFRGRVGRLVTLVGIKTAIWPTEGTLGHITRLSKHLNSLPCILSIMNTFAVVSSIKDT